jgi:hypothetical protein
MDFKAMAEIADDVAAAFAKFPEDRVLSFLGLQSVPETEGRIKFLAKVKDCFGIDSNSFTEINRSVLDALRGDGTYLRLDNVKSLDPAGALALSELLTGALVYLPSLTELDDQTAQNLRGFRGKFNAYKLEKLSVGAIDALADGTEFIELGLKNINAEIAQALCKSKEITINQVHTMDDETCAVFGKYKGKLNIEGIRHVSKEGGRNLLKLKKRLYTTKTGYYSIG